MYINGEWVGKELDTVAVTNPATGEVITHVPKGGKEEAKQAVDAAYEAFPAWSEKTAAERSALLWKWYQLINEQKRRDR